MPISPVSVLRKEDISVFHKEIYNPATGHVHLIPGGQLLLSDKNHLQLWCLQNSRYQLVSLELVEWLHELIGLKHALEIGAGMGDLGYHVGITMTDSAVQTRPEVRLQYALANQPIIDPPASVERLEALEAVRKYQPEIVVASWVTQVYQEGDEQKRVGSSAYGVDELALWRTPCVKTYIHIGNEAVHGDKRLLSQPHETHRFPWLVSRASAPEKNVIYVWRK